VRCGAAYNRGVPGGEKTNRVLALDVGTRRIGIAVTDELGITAQGLPTLERQNKRADLAALGRVAQEYGIAEIVVGMPLRMSGEEGTQAEKVRALAGEIERQCGVPVTFWDERLTSTEANRRLDEAGMTRLDRKGKVDQMAAVMILQAWLEKKSRG
jgi:putative holliday junction resolvase